MTDMVLQITNDARGVRASWIPRSAAHGRQSRYYHPDCTIFVSGRDSDTVGYVVMLALQDCNMPVNALRREKSGGK